MKPAVAKVHFWFCGPQSYNIWGKATACLGNDKVTVGPHYDSQLLALCQRAMAVTG